MIQKDEISLKRGFGYKSDEVDNLLDSLFEELDALREENHDVKVASAENKRIVKELSQALLIVRKEVANLKETEEIRAKNIMNILETANQTAHTIIENAKKEASILRGSSISMPQPKPITVETNVVEPTPPPMSDYERKAQLFFKEERDSLNRKQEKQEDTFGLSEQTKKSLERNKAFDEANNGLEMTQQMLSEALKEAHELMDQMHSDKSKL